MAYYIALTAAWNNVTQPPPGVTGTALTGGMTTQQKINAVNGWTIVGSIPTSFFITGSQLLNCINFTEFNNLTAAQQANLLALCANPGQLLGGSGTVDRITDGMIVNYFTVSAAISSGTYNNATGVVVLTMGATIKFGTGAKIIVSGLTGTGAFAALNGTFTTVTTTSGTTVTYNAGAGLGASTITGGAVTPPTIAALTALAQAAVQPWWQVSAASGGGGLTAPIGTQDTTAAGLT
jgi:hypothetical protein